MVGPLDAAAVTAAAHHALGGWDGEPAPTPGPFPEPDRLLILQDRTAGDVQLLCAAPEPAEGAAEAARYVATAAFGGFYGSRLAARHAELSAQGFEIYSGRDVLLDIPRSLVRARMPRSQARQVLTALREEFRRIAREPFSSAEVARASGFCAAQLLAAFDSPALLADLLRQLAAAGHQVVELDRLPARLRAVSADEVSSAGAQLFDERAMTTVALGDLDADALAAP
ncbi:insulinase family protein [Streptomyces sp. NPDC001351]|uniref:insulinase family protein n=1 Tax=Streptomyces sp. NPDC001351 TaxID=3364564 RepID=UPI0036A39882